MLEELKIVRKLIHRPVRGWISGAIFGSCLIAGLDMVGVAAMLPLMQLLTGGSVADGILGDLARVFGTNDPQSLIVAIAIAIGVAFSLKSVLTVSFRWWLLGHTTKLEAEAAAELMRRYVFAPYWAHRQREISIVYRNIVSAVSQAFGQVVLGLIGILADLLTLLAIGVILMMVSPLATLFAFLLFGLLGWGVQQGLKKQHRNIGETVARSDLSAWNALMPGLNGFRETRLSGSADQFVDRFSHARFERADANRLLSLVSELPKYILEIGFIVGIAGIASVLFLTNDADSALAILAVFAAAAVRMLPTLNRAVSTVGVIRAGQVGLAILAREVKALDNAGYHVLQPRHPRDYDGDITVEDVSYRYEDADRDILHHVSTRISRGQATAFVGSSGAGKSTLLDILLGLLEPGSGVVRCGGHDIRDDLTSWYATLGVVPQEVYILDATLGQNIAFGVEHGNIDLERLHEAIKLAQLESLLEELPEGLQTRLGERGVRLSGGQRQRVGIARALYRRPRFLVLDEATSALDNATEQKISQTIELLSGSVTIILVAHRLSTVKNADKIVFLSKGRIEAEGTFREVEKASEEFAHLVALGKLG